MIDIHVPVAFIWLLRWLLFLGPLFAFIFLAWQVRENERTLVGCLFAFLYGIGTIFATHQLAIYMGWWSYGNDALMLMGMPVDILLGGAILFGPVLYLLFPRTNPLYLVIPIVLLLHGTVFSSLDPLVHAGKGWFFGVVLVFLVAHIPAILLARWTAENQLLPMRAALLATGFGFLAFMVLPSVIMQTMGDEWAISDIPAWRLILGLPILAVCFLIGLTGVQMFAIHGQGTPIPLDPTQRLVRSGIYAYVNNPMQLCSATGWIVLGFILGNIWVASAALMAWVFVAGMVRWHHRHDLLVRFPKGWPEYRSHVHEWIPRWKPWIAEPSCLFACPENIIHNRICKFLKNRKPTGLRIETCQGSKLIYEDADRGMQFVGWAALGKALNHINFFWALVGAACLLVVLPLDYLRNLKSNLKSSFREASNDLS